MIAWTVDGVAPTADLSPLNKITQSDSQSLSYRGSDEGGSGIERYEVRVRRSRPQGDFATDPVTLDRSSDRDRVGSVAVAPGETACVSVRSIDGAGNSSEWTAERCTTRQVGESALHKTKGWRVVHRKSLSGGSALETRRHGASLSFDLNKASDVRVFAGRCRNCGKLEVLINGHRSKLIDLGRTKRRRTEIVAYNVGWHKRGDGHLRLVARGGGAVRIDGISVLRNGSG
jgi:hypothetical protein